MSKTLSYLGFAKKAGTLIAGSGTCEVAMRKGKVKLLLVAKDIAAGSGEKAMRLARNAGVPCRVYGTGEELSHMTGMTGRYVFGITDAHFAEVMASSIDREEGRIEEG